MIKNLNASHIKDQLATGIALIFAQYIKPMQTSLVKNAGSY